MPSTPTTANFSPVYAGAFSYTISFDDNGTPSDLSDDIKLPPPTIVRDVGLKPDECAIVVDAIG